MKVIGTILYAFKVIAQFLVLLLTIAVCMAWDYISPVTRAKFTNWIPRSRETA